MSAKGSTIVIALVAAAVGALISAAIPRYVRRGRHRPGALGRREAELQRRLAGE